MTQDRSTGRPAPYQQEPTAGQVEPGPQFPAPTAPPLDPNQPAASHPADQMVVPPPAEGRHHGTVRRSRFGGLWVGLIVAALILVLLLIFILQNSQSVQIEFFGLSGQAPLAVAILLGVAAGALLVAVPGSVRIMQLRKAAKHD